MTAGWPLFSSLPPDIQTAKEIKVGSDVSYAPIEFFQTGTQQVDGSTTTSAKPLAPSSV